MSESAGNNLHFIPFNNRKIPKFLEVKNKEWISYGEKNDYPYYLLDLYKRSETNSSIINDKVNYIAGGGWTYDKRGVVTVSQRAIAEKLISQPFADTNLNKTTLKLAKDYEIFGGFAVLVKWSKNKRTFTLEHVDFCNLRTNADRSKFYYTRGWFTYKNGVAKENKKPEEEKDWMVYDAYDPNNRKGTQVHYYCTYFPDQYVYPIPVYQGACTWIESEVAYADFQYFNIKKSFSPTKIINIYGTVPAPEMQDTIAEQIKRNFTGEEGDRIVVGFHASKELGIEAVDSMVQDGSVLYNTIATQSTEGIFKAHRYPKLLLGITTEGTLGQRNETATFEEMFQNKYVNIVQREFEEFFNGMASDIGIGIKLKLKRVKSVDWMPDDATIARVIGDTDLGKYVREKLAFDSITKMTFANQEKPVSLDIFAKFGVDADKYEVIDERDIPSTDPIEIEKFERDYLRLQFADVKVKSVDRSVLDLINKDPFMPIDNIASAIKVAPAEVKDAIGRLVERGYLIPSKEAIAGEKIPTYEVSKEAQSVLNDTPAKTEQYQVMYSYDVASGMPKAVSGSRPFCAELMKMNRLYTRDEINTMSDQEGRNVWTLRGGWYHNPKTEINQPQCRHTWRQKIVKAK